MTDERWLERQHAKKAGNDLVRPPLPLFLGARARDATFEVGATALHSDTRRWSDRPAVAPGARDRELASVPQARELGRHCAFALDESQAERASVREHAAKARRETGNASEYGLDDAMVLEQLGLTCGPRGLPR
jgi:hypothetical protein